ncbi:MAG: autotransporter domain-containing protein, partial [Planctomycetaceae bacterium]|nr:autotransporter domain-containing protein [Planctomycetaceae bacterium]
KTGTGAALGISLGAYNLTANDVDYGYAAANTLILGGDIDVTSNSGDAIGIFAGQIAKLDVSHKISATGSTDSSYGIKTVGKTASSDTEKNKNSTINIIHSDAIITGTTKSISLGATSGDVVNLNVANWSNGGNAFTMEGVEYFYVKETNDFSTTAGIKDSKRGKATDPTLDTFTTIASGKTFTVLNSFFDGGNQVINGGGTLNIKKEGTSVGLIDKLTFDGVNVDFENGAQLVFNTTSGDRLVNITNNSTVTFHREGNDISGIGAEEWLTSGNDWRNEPIKLTVSGGSTLKFTGYLTNGDSAWFLHPFEAYVGEGGATIDVATGMIVETGKVSKGDTTSTVFIKKTGEGELKLVNDFSLGDDGIIYLSEGKLSVSDIRGNAAIIKDSPNLIMSNDSKFSIEDAGLAANMSVNLAFLSGQSDTKILLGDQRLAVTAGTFSGKITGLANSQIIKNGSDSLIINGDNSGMAGALIQNDGTVTLQSNWGDGTHAGHIDQKSGTFIFNGGVNNSLVKVFGDAKFEDEVEIKGRVTAKSFELGSDATVTISVNPLNQDWSNLITTDTAFDQTTQNTLTDAAKAAGLLFSRTGEFNDAKTAFSIEYETTTLHDYALKEGMTRNISRMGNLFDGLMVKFPNFADGIYNADAEAVDSLLSEFLGSELAANAQFLAFSNPQYRVFNHLRSIDRSAPSGIFGQSFRILSLNYDLWFEGNFRSEQVKRDGDSLGYDIERGGMFVGLDAKLGDRIISGLAFSYGNPHISNRVGKITADDISFGIYSRFKLFWECSINVFLGYGVQNYKYNRAGNTTDYNGDSLYASMEVVRPLPFYDFGQLFPIFAIDFQKAWSDAFDEGDPNNLGIHVGKSNIDQAILRFGLNSKIMPTRQFHLRTRLQYGLQVAGDLYASATTSFIVNPAISQNLRSVKRGRNNLNVGIGTDVYTMDEQTRFFFDYDYDYNKKSNAHSLQIGIITTR